MAMSYYERTVSRSQQRIMMWLLSSVTVVVLAAVVMVLYSFKQPTGPRPLDEVAGAQRIVRDRLPPGVEIHFCDPVETSVRRESGGKLRVMGWVDLISPDGQSVRETFSCLMHLGPDRQWIPDDVELLEKD